MHTNKRTIDESVLKIMKSSKSQREFESKCYSIASAYAKHECYDEAANFCRKYLNSQPNAINGNNLMASILQALRKPNESLAYLKTSVRNDPNQPNVLLRICELLTNPDVELEYEDGKQWLEKAKLYHPNHKHVVNLHDRLVTICDDQPEELKSFYVNELKMRPQNVSVQINYVKLLANRLKDTELAFQTILQVEQKSYNAYKMSLQWTETVYEILNDMYERTGAKSPLPASDQLLFLLVVIAIRRLRLSFGESSATNDPFRLYLQLDVNLKKWVTDVSRKFDSEFANHFCDFVKAELCFALVCLAYRLLRKSLQTFSECEEFLVILLQFAFDLPTGAAVMAAADASDFVNAATILWGDEWQSMLVGEFDRRTAYRKSQSGHLLYGLIRDKSALYFGAILERFVCNPDAVHGWSESVYRKIFLSVAASEPINAANSFFCESIKPTELAAKPLFFETELVRIDVLAQQSFPGSLHEFLWLIQHYEKFENFELTFATAATLPYEIQDPANCSVTNLCCLDLLAFFQLCYECYGHDPKSMPAATVSKPKIIYPACLSDSYCPPAIAALYTSIYNVLLSPHKATPTYGERQDITTMLKVVRCQDNAHLLNIHLVLKLAKTFNRRGQKLCAGTAGSLSSRLSHPSVNVPEHADANLKRAEKYWSIAIDLLEKLQSNDSSTSNTIFYENTSRLFLYRPPSSSSSASGSSTALDSERIAACLEEGKLFLASRFLQRNDNEKAERLLQHLQSPYASFYLGQIYRNTARDNQNENLRKSLIARAYDYYYITLRRLGDPNTEPDHPLNAVVSLELEGLDKFAKCSDSMAQPASASCQIGGTASATKDSLNDFNMSIAFGNSSNTLMNSTTAFNQTAAGLPYLHATPKTNRYNEQPQQSLTPYPMLQQPLPRRRFDLTAATVEPSPERLDAEIRSLKYTRDEVLNRTRSQFNDLMQEIVELKSFQETTLPNLLNDVKRDLIESFDKLLIGSRDKIRTVIETVVETKLSTALASIAAPATKPEPSMSTSMLNESLSHLTNISANVSQWYQTFAMQQQQQQLVQSMYRMPVYYPGTVPPSTGPITIPPPPIPTGTPETATTTYSSFNTPSVINQQLITAQSTLKPQPSPLLNFKTQQPHLQQFASSPIPVKPPSSTLASKPAINNSPIGISPVVATKPPLETPAAAAAPATKTEFSKVVSREQLTATNADDDNDEVLFSGRAKLFTYAVDKRRWKPCCDGTAYVSRHFWLDGGKTKNATRFLMKSLPDGSLRANHYIRDTKNFQAMTKGESKSYIWSVADVCLETITAAASSSPAMKTATIPVSCHEVCLQFETVALAKKFASVFEADVRDKSVPLSTTAVVSTPTTTRLLSEPSLDASKKIGFGGFMFKSNEAADTATANANVLKTPELVRNEPQTTASKNIFENFKFSFTGPSTVLGSSSSAAAMTKSPLGQKNDDDDDAEDDFVPTAVFKPVIDQLPELVDVKTGEENCEIVFETRAKLLRFDRSVEPAEWKERGLGQMKILKSDDLFRLLMRRERILTICCNHQLLREMRFEMKSGSDKHVVWYAKDFADQELKEQLLALRLPDAAKCREFLQAIEQCQRALNDQNRIAGEKTVAVAVAAKVDEDRSLRKFLPPPTNWECQTCYVSNVEKNERCVSCGSLRNPVKMPASTIETTSRRLFGAVTTATTTASTSSLPTTFSFLTGSLNTSKIQFGSMTTPTTTTTTTTAANNPMLFSFGSGSKQSMFSKPTASKVIESDDSDCVFVSEMKPTPEEIRKAESLQLPATFYNYLRKQPCSGCDGCEHLTDTENEREKESKVDDKKKDDDGDNNRLAKSPVSKLGTQTGPISFGFGEKKLVEESGKAGGGGTGMGSTGMFGGSSAFFGSLASGTSNARPTDSKFVFASGSGFVSGGSLFGKVAGTSSGPVPVFGSTGPRSGFFGAQESSGGSGAVSMFGGATVTGGTQSSLFAAVATPTTTTGHGTGTAPSLASRTSHESVEKRTPETSVSGNNNNKSTEIVRPFQFGSGQQGSGGQSQPQKTFEFAAKVQPSPTSVPADTETETEIVPLSDNKIFSSQTNVSFASLATNKSFLCKDENQGSGFQFLNAGKPVFGAVAAATSGNGSDVAAAGADDDDDNNDDTTAADDNYDPHYDPIVELPDQIEVKTGEEDEDVLFVERAKLFRFASETSEWKERAVGELKILKQKNQEKYRLLMRRAQVHKIVLNERVSSSIELKPLQSSEKAWTWISHNFIDNESNVETLAIRFADPTIATRFKEALTKCQAAAATVAAQ